MKRLMTIAQRTKELCQRYAIRPARSKGQHFLIREKVYERIVALGEIAPTDTVVEIGPGLGFLTERLAGQAKRVVAIELDDRLAAALRERLAAEGVTNVEVVNEDALKITDDALDVADGTYKLIANIPYNITSRLIRKFLSEMAAKPSLMVLMIQKEVAERLTAQPPALSLLGVSAQLYADVRYAFTVAPGAFWPPPQVSSAVVVLQPHAAVPGTEEIVGVAKAGFAQKRKTLANNLKDGFRIERPLVEAVLREARLPLAIRAQELSLEEWRRLFVVLRQRNMV